MNLPCHVHNIYITLYYINAEIKFYLDLSWRAYNRETNTLWGKVSRVTLDFYIEVWIHNEHSFFRHWATRSHHLWSNWVTGNIPSCTVKNRKRIQNRPDGDEYRMGLAKELGHFNDPFSYRWRQIIKLKFYV